MRQRQGTVSLLPSALVNITGMVAPGADFADPRYQSPLPRSVPAFYALRPVETPAAGSPSQSGLSDGYVRTTRRSPREYLTAADLLPPSHGSIPTHTLSRQLPPAAFFLLVEHRGIINRHRFRTRQMPRHPTFDAGQHFVANTNIGERTAHHHFMVAAP